MNLVLQLNLEKESSTFLFGTRIDNVYRIRENTILNLEALPMVEKRLGHNEEVI